MATMTHSERLRVPSYVTASNLAMRLAKPLFEHAMRADSITDPQDKAYASWYVVRQTAEHFLEDRTVDMTIEQRGEFRQALIVAHEIAHPGADEPILPSDCDCETARTICGIKQLMAGAAVR